MIELAPQSKVGLALSNPVMIAAGCGGYGPNYQSLLDLPSFGALVTNPITLRPRRGPAQPRLIETTAGFVLVTGDQNPGVKKVLQQYGPVWSHLGLPVIAHLPADEPDNLRRTARALCSAEPGKRGSVAALELDIPLSATPQDAQRWLRAIHADCLLPVLVKLPLATAEVMAEMAVAAGGDALVIGAPPLAAAVAPGSDEVVNGCLYGPALHGLALAQLHLIRQLVDVPLVAAGGIHSPADARAFLAAGAAAVQIDSLLFIDPQAAGRIAASFQSSQIE